jgi:hypothetical protein
VVVVQVVVTFQIHQVAVVLVRIGQQQVIQ